MTLNKSYILCIEKKKLLKIYNNIMNSIKLENRMNVISMNSGNSKKFDPHRLYSILQIKLTKREVINVLLHQTLGFTIQGKIRNIKKSHKNYKFK